LRVMYQLAKRSSAVQKACVMMQLLIIRQFHLAASDRRERRGYAGHS
jgi:hypothetical protein